MSMVSPERVRELNAAAMRDMAAGRLRDAQRLLEEAVGLDARNVPAWLNLAASRRGQGDLDGALAAAEGALRADPQGFMPLLMKGSLLERQGKTRDAGAAYHYALVNAPPPEQLDPPTRQALGRAQAARDAYLADMEQHLRDRLPTGGSGPDARRMERLVGMLVGKRRIYQQEPVQFHYPGLPAIEFYDREEFPWIEAFEAATPDIQAELAQVLADESAAGDLRPYIQYADGLPLNQWAELNNSARWSAYHFFDYGTPIEAHCRRCPKTVEAIAALPQPRVAGRTPSAMFSILQPRTRIPPHTGVANTRLVVHLPLVVPPGCGFRVGNETRAWEVGEAFVFDDTIEHEAWNDSDQLRVVFICDVWNPRLSEGERAMITEVMAALDDFTGAPPPAGL